MQFKQPTRRRINRSYLILLALLASGIITAILAGTENGVFDIRGAASNLSMELIGGVITFAIIERLINDREDQDRLKYQLIREMENPDNGVTKRAVGELRHHDWLQDGSLAGWFLQRANLEGLYLTDANFKDMGLYRSSLRGAKITDQQFVQMNDLRFTLMPDGNMYDGRYCLPGDVNWAHTKYGIDVRTATLEQMSEYYGVPIERYIEGQRWAQQNLYALCGRTPTLTIVALQ